MAPFAGVYLFLLGLASGITLLTMSSYRHVSPSWLRGLLMFSGLFMLSRYMTMALFTLPDAPQRFWPLYHCWFASAIGLTFPSVMVIDQLLRHPAMSPSKLLIWFSPFLVLYIVVILLGTATPAIESTLGWTPRLHHSWLFLLSATQAVFVIGFIVICLLLIRRTSLAPIRSALIGLVLGYSYLGVDGLIVAMGRWYFRPFLFSEIVALIAIWYAYETGVALQTNR